MKNQLLEDIDDSKSRIPVPPVRRVQPVMSPQEQALTEPEPQRDAWPASTGAASGAVDEPAHGRAGVWRKRAPSPRHAAWIPRPPATPETRPAPAPEPPRAAARAAPPIAPEIASFSSRAPDWSIPLQPEAPPWTERWGRKALGWSFALGAVLAIAAGAAWMVHETEVESSLAVVADHTQARPAVLAEAPMPEPEAEPETTAPPPLKLLPPEPVAAAPAATSPLQGEGLAAAADVVASDTAPMDTATASALAAAAAAPPVVKKPTVKRTPQRRLASATPVRRSRTETTKPAPKAVRERAREPVLARAPTVPARSLSADQPDPESPLAETLRMCRAAGYHATACLKRGCEATRFGLVCRG